MTRFYLGTDVEDYVEMQKKAVESTGDLFEELWGISETVEATPNPMNKKYNIKRKQATFGDSYSFAGQKSQKVPIPEYAWPEIVKRVLQDTRDRSGCQQYNVVHVNWYPDGSAGLDPHSDDMRAMVDGKSIYSYTFLSTPGVTRGFQVYDKKDSAQVKEFMLDDGDLLMMTAHMQLNFKHGVKKSAAKRFKELRRINLTVRAWK